MSGGYEWYALGLAGGCVQLLGALAVVVVLVTRVRPVSRQAMVLGISAMVATVLGTLLPWVVMSAGTTWLGFDPEAMLLVQGISGAVVTLLFFGLLAGAFATLARGRPAQ